MENKKNKAITPGVPGSRSSEAGGATSNTSPNCASLGVMAASCGDVPHAGQPRAAGDLRALPLGWRRLRRREYVGEAYVKTCEAFLARGGIQPESGPGVVYARVELVCLEHRRRESVQAGRCGPLEDVQDSAADAHWQLWRLMDARRAVKLLCAQLGPRDQMLLTEAVNNNTPEQWAPYERSEGIVPNTRHKRVNVLRNKVLRILRDHGLAYLVNRADETTCDAGVRRARQYRRQPTDVSLAS